MKFKSLFITFFCIISIVSCNSEFEDFTLEEGRFFYPIEVGLNTTFMVDSIIYNPFQQDVTDKRTYVREFIESSYIDDAGNLNYRIERYTGNSPDDVNNFSAVWYISVRNKSIDRIEENLRFVKMIFPVLQNANWLAHRFIVTDATNSYLKGWKYTYQNMNQPFTVADSTFADKVFGNTVTIRQFGDSTNIIQTRGREIYAKDVGLIFRQTTYLDGSTPCRRLCPEQTEACVNNCFTLPLDVRADNGFIVTIRYVKHEVL